MIFLPLVPFLPDDGTPCSDHEVLRAFAPFAGQDGAILFDSAASAGGRGRWSFLCVSPQQIEIGAKAPFKTLGQWQNLIQQALSGILADSKDTLQSLWPEPGDRPPFFGGLAGWLSYEAGWHLETLPPPCPDDLAIPETAFAVYDVVVAFDLALGQGWVIGWPGREQKANAIWAQVMQAMARPLAAPAPQGTILLPDQTRPQAEAAIRMVVEAIHAGEIFQGNVTQRFRGTLPAALSPWDLYRRLRDQSAAPFAAMASFGGAHLLSASPERFLRVDAHGQVETRPIKGTRPRGKTPSEDQALAEELLNSPKDRAENLMIVDLLRNDLSRSCEMGSVKVPVLCGLETFASVHHLVSVVTGQLRQGCDALTLLQGAFPGGSITGAPKIHAMEILRALEPCRRGLYCGSLFWLGADGAFDSSILIRSLAIGPHGQVAAQAGGGIVSDSDPAAEWQEAMTKLAPLLRAVAGPQQDPA